MNLMKMIILILMMLFFPMHLKKGNEILDKAGFKKKGKYRVQPNGKPLTIRLAAMTGSGSGKDLKRKGL